MGSGRRQINQQSHPKDRAERNPSGFVQFEGTVIEGDNHIVKARDPNEASREQNQREESERAWSRRDPRENRHGGQPDAKGDMGQSQGEGVPRAIASGEVSARLLPAKEIDKGSGAIAEEKEEADPHGPFPAYFFRSLRKVGFQRPENAFHEDDRKINAAIHQEKALDPEIVIPT